eukprot:6861448-Pyramimonas_sp.AAC.1
MTRSLALLLALALWGVMRGRRHDSDAVSRIGSRRAQTRLSGVVLGMGLASHSVISLTCFTFGHFLDLRHNPVVTLGAPSPSSAQG